ncbi:hypothetical protein P7C70_g5701, partial [Phenoliferia sp. Uapishka_3]
MAAYKVALTPVLPGEPANPSDPRYFFCICTPCTTSYADNIMNMRGRWQLIGTWEAHRRNAQRDGRDADCFSANPLVGHVARALDQDIYKVEEDLEAEGVGGENRAEFGDQGQEVDVLMDGEWDGGEEHQGGHDEFVYDHGGSGSEGDAGDAGADVGESGDADVVVSDGGASDQEGEDEDGREDDDEEWAHPPGLVDVDSEYDSEEESEDEEGQYPEAEEGPLRYEPEYRREGEDEYREREADDEEAQFNHHRPQLGEEDEEPIIPDLQEDDDENLAKLMQDADVFGFAVPDGRDPTPGGEWEDNDFGGGAVDFERQDEDEEDGAGDEAGLGRDGQEPAGVEAGGAQNQGDIAGDGAAGDGGQEEPGADMDDENAGGAGRGARDEELEEAPAVLPGVAGVDQLTAPKAVRMPRAPFAPCEAPNRILDRDDTVRLHLFEMAVEYLMGPKLIERIRWFLKEIGVEVTGIESLHKLRQEAFRISAAQLDWYHHCPGHTSSSNPATKDWTVCEVVMNIKLGPKSWGTKVCGQLRYFPLNTPNLQTLRKNSRRLGQDLPPLDKVPTAQHSHMGVGPFVDAIYANPEHSADLLRANLETIEAARTDAERITSYETAEMPRKLYHPDSGVCWDDDMILSTTSDGADIYPDACPNQPVKAHVAAVRIPALTSKIHDLCFVCGVNGPRKGATTLYLHAINADLVKLEATKRRYHAARRGMVTSRVFAGLNCSDTVEQCDLSNTVGAAGRCPSMLHETRGVFNILTRHWQHPLKNFARVAELETADDPYDLRGDVRTAMDDDDGAEDDGHVKYPPVVCTIETYEATNLALESALTVASFEKTRRQTGIKGRSIYSALGIYWHTYPWIFALDDMHVTYSNNMKHFLISLFGKSASKPTARGKMISSVNHFKMAAALQRTIHLQPSSHGQKVRGIEHLNRLKAAETRSFLWFHLAPLFYGVFEHRQDMALVVAAIRSTRLTNHRVLLRTAAFDKQHKTYEFNDDGEFTVPLANLIRAQDQFLIKRKNLFVGRDYTYGGTCVPSLVRAQALPDMCRMWGPGLLATTQWALEGKIGDLKRLAKSRALPVKNMENNNIYRNMMVLIRLRYDFAKYDPEVSDDLRHKHPRLESTTFLHKKEPKPVLTDSEIDALDDYLTGLGLAMGTKTPTRWQRLQISTGEIIGSISRERGTELERIVLEDDAPENNEKERLGIRRATRFCKYTVRPKPNQPELADTRSHELFEVDSYMEVPLAPDNRPLFVALGRTFPPLKDKFKIQQAFEMGNADRKFVAIGVEQIRHGVGLTLGLKGRADQAALWWVTMNVHKAAKYQMSQF